MSITKVQRGQNGYIQAPGNFFTVIAEEVQRGKPGPFTLIKEAGGRELSAIPNAAYVGVQKGEFEPIYGFHFVGLIKQNGTMCARFIGQNQSIDYPAQLIHGSAFGSKFYRVNGYAAEHLAVIEDPVIGDAALHLLFNIDHTLAFLNRLASQAQVNAQNPGNYGVIDSPQQASYQPLAPPTPSQSAADRATVKVSIPTTIEIPKYSFPKTVRDAEAIIRQYLDLGGIYLVGQRVQQVFAQSFQDIHNSGKFELFKNGIRVDLNYSCAYMGDDIIGIRPEKWDTKRSMNNAHLSTMSGYSCNLSTLKNSGHFAFNLTGGYVKFASFDYTYDADCHLTIAAFYGADGKNKFQFVFLANENINDKCRMNNWNLPAA